MCNFTALSPESYKEHKLKHQKELNVGSTSSYPINVYTIQCTPCEISFRTHDNLMDHMCKVHLTEEQRSGKKFEDSLKSLKQTSQAVKPPPCKNGPQCYYHRQSRCNFFHDQPPQQKQVRFRRQVPSNQWKSVPNRQHHNNQQSQYQQPHQQWAHNTLWQSLPNEQNYIYQENGNHMSQQYWAQNRQWPALRTMQEENQNGYSYQPQQVRPQENNVWGVTNFTNQAFQGRQ